MYRHTVMLQKQNKPRTQDGLQKESLGKANIIEISCLLGFQLSRPSYMALKQKVAVFDGFNNSFCGDKSKVCIKLMAKG